MTRRARRIYPNLATYFLESGETQQDFARRYNRSQAWVAHIKANNREPALLEAIRISQETGVPLESLARKGPRP